ncbi:MAG: CPBP family intramembrane metalloprotease [Caldilineae bacterium]|nr:MAG: CPBP family intramembrane metalloprotease [Caldilineae bacterium]
MIRSRRFPIFVGLVIALVLPFIFSYYLGSVREHVDEADKVVGALAREWGITFLLLLLIWKWERRPLRSIGVGRMNRGDVMAALGGFVLGALAFAITTPLVSSLGLGSTGAGIAQLARVPVPLRLLIVLTAGVTEEILFRGYPIERMAELTGRLITGAGIAYIAFVLLHIPFWGAGGTIQIGTWSLIVTALYVWRRNLPACILMHILNDAYAFILLPALFGRYLP